MSKKRLEEMKGYLDSTFTDDNYEVALCELIGVPKEQLKWLIRFAEEKAKRVEELEKELRFGRIANYILKEALDSEE